MKHRRFRFGRRDDRSLSPESLESVLSEAIPSGNDEMSFEDSVLGQVDAARPFLDKAERRQVRWIRMSILGLALGVFASGVIAVRAGLLPGSQGPGVVAAVVDSAQSESLGQIESASTWRSDAIMQLTALRDQHRSIEQARQESSNARQAVFVSSRPAARPQTVLPARVPVGLTMQSPCSPILEADNASCQQVIVFTDGLAIPAGRTFVLSGAPTGTVTIWPSNVQQSIEQLGLEGSGECAIGGINPPWYSSDVIRLPEIVTVNAHPDPRFPN